MHLTKDSVVYQLFDLVYHDPAWTPVVAQELSLHCPVAILRANASYCAVDVIRDLCQEALKQLDEEPIQLRMF